MTRLHRGVVRACGALALSLCATVGAGAQVAFEGYTNACTGAACMPDVTSASVGQETKLRGVTEEWGETVDVLSFWSGFFSTSTSEAGTGSISLGNFRLHTSLPDDMVFGSWQFGLLTTFTAPVDHSELFSAVVNGTVSYNRGYAHINFDRSGPVAFGSQGQYTLQLDDLYLGRVRVDGVSYNFGNDAVLKGYVTASTVTPEPVSMALLGTGLAGLAAVRRRRARAEA